jgi:nucleoside-diphosphate-sugar epimerase
LKIDGYILSKCLQEKEIREYLKKQDREWTPEIVTLHPSFIIGPPLNISTNGSSIDGFYKMATGELPAVPKMHMPAVDVRDCA